MAPSPEALSKARAMIASAKARGLSWAEMRTNAHKAADSVGTSLAAVITSGNDAFDGDIEKLTAEAQRLRELYAAFLQIWYDEASAEDAKEHHD